MDSGCGALVGKSDDVELTLKNPRDDDSNGDIDDGCDGAELLAAAEEGRGEDVMSILVKNPGLIRIGDLVGNTVLHMAARDGDIVTVCNLIVFLEERQDAYSKEVLKDANVDGDTALHLALKNGHRKVAYHLIKADEWTGNIRNNYWITPYRLAEQAGFSEVCELCAFKRARFHSFVDVDVEIEEEKMKLRSRSKSVPVQWTDLERAIKKGDEDALVMGLMRDGKELVRQKNTQGETLLHAATTAPAMGPFRQLVQFMISNGLTDAALLGNRKGNTALHIATKNGKHSKAIGLIIAAPTAMYQVNDKGVSPLYLAVKFRHEDLVKIMVAQTCLPSWESEMRLHPKHATLAHLAIKERSLGTLNILLKQLPELVKGTNEKGWRPLSYAANKGYLDEVTYLLTHFPNSAEECDIDGSFPVHKAVGGGHISVIKAFYEHCPQTLHHIDKKGRSVLHIAAIYDRADIFTYLTKEIKMDDSFMNLEDKKGKTFIDYAKELKH